MYGYMHHDHVLTCGYYLLLVCGSERIMRPIRNGIGGEGEVARYPPCSLRVRVCGQGELLPAVDVPEAAPGRGGGGRFPLDDVGPGCPVGGLRRE